jgi:hypothetical protein
MKISDPLGKVYSHTMFRRRSYDMHDENDATTTPTPDPNPTPPPPLPPHTNRGGYFDGRNRSRSRDRVVEEEDEDRESVASERSDDSLSTKSSRIVGGNSRRISSRRNQRGMSSVRSGILIRFKNILLWPMPLFLLSTHKQCILSHFMHNSTAAMFP